MTYDELNALPTTKYIFNVTLRSTILTIVFVVRVLVKAGLRDVLMLSDCTVSGSHNPVIALPC